MTMVPGAAPLCICNKNIEPLASDSIITKVTKCGVQKRWMKMRREVRESGGGRAFCRLAVKAEPCTSPWQCNSLTDTCYFVSNDTVMNFNEAKLKCSEAGAQLFVKPPAYGYTQVFSDIKGIIYGSFSAGRYHVGLVRNSSGMYWLDGTYLQLSSNGSCGYLYFMSAYNISHGSDSCRTSRFICQKSSNVFNVLRNIS
ncbi:predicted protein [Nematostella vectensis]|uniref:C-type lectin domain-containing protein n=1 Tax=Nematostella vectensis TaxID=45351 RepID=A7SG59_NEMVE|nr:predicted protein [Nematostella vectensis]|eukprot:XP_001629402.1 predicted protein [Nematostella vectensis]